MRRAELERHLILRAQLKALLVHAAAQVPHMQRVAILAAEQQLGVHTVLYHVRCSPLAGDQGVMSEMPPEVVREILIAAILLPSPTDLEGFRIEGEDATGAVTAGRAKGVDENAIWSAVDGVRRGITGLRLHFGSLDDF